MSAWQNYDLFTAADGSIHGETSTNDDNDDGYSDGSVEHWSVSYRDYAEMLRRTHGGCHVGCSGIEVNVYLDGKRVPYVPYDQRKAS